MSLLSGRRKTYALGALSEADMDPDPIAQFGSWLEQALASDLLEPTAMNLATVGASGRPSARMVLLKGVEAGGFVFYSNYASRKGRELAANPHAALTFYWDALERQVRVEGQVEKLSREASERYFQSRPRGSQLAAAASRQSEALPDKAALEARIRELSERYPEGTPIPMPDDWGGYRLVPDTLEFWQGRPDRAHDRFRYERAGEGWRLTRLSP
jgi:pyridoxamine 5'-phosphate oxidase